MTDPKTLRDMAYWLSLTERSKRAHAHDANPITEAKVAVALGEAANRLEAEAKWQEKAVEYLRDDLEDDCRCDKKRRYLCINCRCRRLLADAPKGGGDES